MSHDLQFYIDGAWVDPIAPKTLDVIDPSTEEAFAKIAMGSAADVDRAVAAAKAAFPAFSRTSRAGAAGSCCAASWRSTRRATTRSPRTLSPRDGRAAEVRASAPRPRSAPAIWPR